MPRHFLHASLRIPHKSVKKIIQTDMDIGVIKKPVSVMISKLAELFLQRLIEKGGERAQEEENCPYPTLRMSHIASVIRNDVRMDFLIPLIKDWEDTPKHKTNGFNLKMKEKKTVTEHLMKGGTPVLQLKYSVDHLLTENKSSSHTLTSANSNSLPLINNNSLPLINNNSLMSTSASSLQASPCSLVSHEDNTYAAVENEPEIKPSLTEIKNLKDGCFVN